MYSTSSTFSAVILFRNSSFSKLVRTSSPSTRKSNGLGGSNASKWFTTSDNPYRVNLPGTARGVGAMRNFSGKRVTKRHVIWTSSGEDAAISESSLWKLGLAKEKQERPACARGVRWRD